MTTVALRPYAQPLGGVDRFVDGEAGSYPSTIRGARVSRLFSPGRAEARVTSAPERVAGGAGRSCRDRRSADTPVAGGGAGLRVGPARPHGGGCGPC